MIAHNSTRETLRKLLVARELGALQKNPGAAAPKRAAAQPPKNHKAKDEPAAP